MFSEEHVWFMDCIWIQLFVATPQFWWFGSYVLFLSSNPFIVIMILKSTFLRTTKRCFYLLIFVLNIIVQYNNNFLFFVLLNILLSLSLSLSLSNHKVFPLNRVHEVTVKKSPTVEQNIMLIAILVQLAH